ncbi:MAG: GHMP kinase [Thaumarchaeota archaeon]|nr:GHMP kinase [Nitrososphaerota archaeon]
MRAEAFSPCHITGFFSASSKGSTGAGISLDLGVRTKVVVRPYHRDRFEVYINGRPDPAPTSTLVLRRYSRLFGRPIWAKVEHLTELPVGFGFGTSGAGALGLSLAMNEALGLSLSREEAGRIAHEAEIEAKTGLGTVVAEYQGGFELRLRPSAPGEGGIVKLPMERGYKLVVVPIAPMKTSRALSDRRLVERINGLGAELLKEFKRRPRVEEFMKLSSRFSDSIMPKDGQERLLRELRARGYVASLPIFGNAPFILVKEAEEASRTVEKLGYRPIVTEVCEEGARLL